MIARNYKGRFRKKPAFAFALSSNPKLSTEKLITKYVGALLLPQMGPERAESTYAEAAADFNPVIAPKESGQAGYFDKVYPFEFLRAGSERSRMGSVKVHKGRFPKGVGLFFCSIEFIE